MRRVPFLLLAVVAAIVVAAWQHFSPRLMPVGLPPEVSETLQLIDRGGPFPHRQDGTVFHNRERLLPEKRRDYYREYTVRTPGARDRGARRVVAGGQPPEVLYYTHDHYRSFRKIDPQR